MSGSVPRLLTQPVVVYRGLYRATETASISPIAALTCLAGQNRVQRFVAQFRAMFQSEPFGADSYTLRDDNMDSPLLPFRVTR